MMDIVYQHNCIKWMRLLIKQVAVSERGMSYALALTVHCKILRFKVLKKISERFGIFEGQPILKYMIK